jgi:hypothetical protein
MQLAGAPSMHRLPRIAATKSPAACSTARNGWCLDEAENRLHAQKGNPAWCFDKVTAERFSRCFRGSDLHA